VVNRPCTQADYEDLRNQIEPLSSAVQRLQAEKDGLTQQLAQRQQELQAATAAAAAAAAPSAAASRRSTVSDEAPGSHPASPLSHRLSSSAAGALPAFVGALAGHVAAAGGAAAAAAAAAADHEQLAAELERSKASVARLLKERDDLDEKLRAVGKELKQAINEKSVQVWLGAGGCLCGARVWVWGGVPCLSACASGVACLCVAAGGASHACCACACVLLLPPPLPPLPPLLPLLPPRVTQDIQLKDLTRTRAALNEAQAECGRLKQQLALLTQ
jgi:hypothetical protein